MITQEQRTQIKSKIMQDLASLKQEIEQLREMTKPIAPECALGDLARFELMHDQQVSEKALALAQIRQNKLNYALRKVDTPEYGLCVECDEEIPFERLLILPESTHCMACASDLA